MNSILTTDGKWLMVHQVRVLGDQFPQIKVRRAVGVEGVKALPGIGTVF